MQIKHQNPRPDIEALPREPSTTIIRYNVFIKGDRPSPDGNRPNLLVDGFPDDGPGSQDRYQVYGNVLLPQPPREPVPGHRAGLDPRQRVCGCSGHGIAVVPHAGKSPRQVFIYHNTFVDVRPGRGPSPGRPRKAFAVVANLPSPTRDLRSRGRRETSA